MIAEAHPLDETCRNLLSRTPESWIPIDWPNLPSTSQEGLLWLFVAGCVEFRVEAECRSAVSADVLNATCVVSTFRQSVLQALAESLGSINPSWIGQRLTARIVNRTHVRRSAFGNLFWQRSGELAEDDEAFIPRGPIVTVETYRVQAAKAEWSQWRLMDKWAKCLGKSRKSLTRMIAGGELRVEERGHDRRFNLEDLAKHFPNYSDQT